MNIFKFWLTFYVVYWVILVGWLIWIIVLPDTIKIISFIVGLGLQIFNTTKVKKMKEKFYEGIKTDILEKL